MTARRLCHLAAMLAAAALASAAPALAARRPVARGAGVPLPGRWQLELSSSFTGSALNESQWNPNWFGASPLAVTDAVNQHDRNCNAPGEVAVSGGLLHLGMTKTPCSTPNGHRYPDTASLTDTLGKFQFTYGYIEARVRIPAGALGRSADNIAFWADGTGDWPATGELDIMEILPGCGPHGSDGFAYHFHSSLGGPGGCARADSTPGWHTFAADWQPGRVTYYYDGRKVGTITKGITSQPMYLILDQSVDPSPGRVVPTSETALVKYVRVWRKRSSATPGAAA